MFGHAIADAMGVPVEFSTRSQRRCDPVTGYRGYGAHDVPAGTWSDDTSMALATIDSLAHGLDTTDMMERFCDWKLHAAYTATGVVFDMGITTSKALSQFKKGVPALSCGLDGEFDNGNGSLMRIIPAVLFCKFAAADLSPDEQLAIIHDVSSLTHRHPRSQREEYITALKYIKKERTDEFLIDFFFRTSIKRMEQEIEEKKNLTENFIRGMEFVRNVKSSNDDISEI